MMLGETIADVPIILASIDPCMSCTDRVTLIDTGRNSEREILLSDIRKQFR